MKHIKTFENINDNNIYFYIRTKNIKKVKELINKNVDVNLRTNIGETLLMSAVDKDFLPGVKELIKAGAKLDLVNSLNRTALWYSACYGYIKITEELIKSGSDWNIIDDVDNKDFFDLLSSDNKKNIIKKFPEKYENYLLIKNSNKFGI